MNRSSLCRLVVPMVGVLLLAAGCGGSDAGVATTIAAATSVPTNTAEIFTEAAGSDSIPVTADVGSAPSSSPSSTSMPANPTGTTTTTTTNTTTGQGRTTTTVAGAPTSSTSTTSPSTGAFVVTTGTAFIDGKTEPTIEVRARPGSSGDVEVPVGSVLDIVIPGPDEWDFENAPQADQFDFIDIDTVPDGPDDPFPEAGGATIATLRPLKASTVAFVFFSYDTDGQMVTVRVAAR